MAQEYVLRLDADGLTDVLAKVVPELVRAEIVAMIEDGSLAKAIGSAGGSGG